MVRTFKRQHTANTIGSEMFDDGLDNYQSDEEVKYEDHQYQHKYEENDYPSIDSPRLTNDIRKTRTMKINKKDDCDAEGEIGDQSNESPEIPNEASPVQL